MMRHLKGLIFDCLSCTEALITSLFTTNGEALDLNSWSTVDVKPSLTAT
jgi:hypothetical protein